ncbi:hypothetical protein [Amycolatopsis sp. CA-230715]|uniref:hypothetical protein n=1 Tax=Amycolatopsis sp. CA-230715 TaxID=2745196 RepID=UPI001C015E48|nr:hypothetical protein [Amycolatopsis sp. CA-230715]QWF85694.1 hypothetical protein HUW46_09174 [Amycolatopsis sp. CA-230715]
MGNSSRPGSVVVHEIDHEPFTVSEQQYVVRELVWNSLVDRSYELVRLGDDAVLTEHESFGEYPSDAQIAAVLHDYGIDVELGMCKFCEGQILLVTAHRHRHGWVGHCCWDDRLRSTE